MELETQNQEIVEAANQAVEQKQSKAAKIMQFATDATRMLSTTADSLQKIKETGFIDRIISLFPGKKKKPANEITKEEFEELKQFAWSSLEAMNQRELLTADALITVKNNLNSLVVEQNDIKEAITQMAQKVADRFSNLENRVAKVESSQNLETWVSNLKYDDAYENVPEAIKFLKVVKGFYLNKQGDYTSNEIKSLKRALDNVGFDFRAKISLEKLLDDLIEELQTFDEQKYLQITKVELPDGKIPSAKELANALAVPSFVAVCSLPENKKLLEDAVEDLREDLGISYEKALQRVVKRRIAKTNGIDLTVETSLFDLGIELISCYSAAPELFGISEDNSEKVASIESSSTNSSYQITGILEGIDLDALKEDCEEYDLETLLKVEEKTHNPVIQCAIGEQYYYSVEDDDDNVLVEEDEDEAEKWFEKAAEQDYAEAYDGMAATFYSKITDFNYSWFEPENMTAQEHTFFQQAIEYQKKAYMLGLESISKCIGIHYLSVLDFVNAEKWYSKYNFTKEEMLKEGFLGISNYAFCEIKLGKEEKAEEICQFAIKETNDYRVYYRLAEKLKEGELCVKYFKKFHESNIYPEGYQGGAARNLGDIYYYGKGVTSDREEAVRWYKICLQQYDKNYAANAMLGECYRFGHGVQIDNMKAYQLYLKAVENDNGWNESQLSLAKMRLGEMFYSGLGVSQDYLKAFEWFSKATEVYEDNMCNYWWGIAVANTYLGVMYENGDGINEDLVKAAEYYQRGANWGLAWAQRNLGQLYYYGDGIEEDEDKAEELLKLAAEQGDEQAKKDLEEWF